MGGRALWLEVENNGNINTAQRSLSGPPEFRFPNALVYVASWQISIKVACTLMNSVFPKQWFFTRSRHPIIKVIPEDTKRFTVIIFLILHVFTLMIRRRDHVKTHCFGKTEFIKVKATLMFICQLATCTNAFGKWNSGSPLNDLWAVWIFPLFLDLRDDGCGETQKFPPPWKKFMSLRLMTPLPPHPQLPIPRSPYLDTADVRRWHH